MLTRLMLVLLGVIGTVVDASASELQKGDLFPPTVLQDQHGEETMIPADTMYVLFAADKGASDVINGFLTTQDGDYLAAHHAVYIADISEMPALITRMFALPKMRKRPYQILLTDEESPLDFLPREASAVTVIRMRDQVVEYVRYAKSADELAERLADATSSP